MLDVPEILFKICTQPPLPVKTSMMNVCRPPYVDEAKVIGFSDLCVTVDMNGHLLLKATVLNVLLESL